MLARILSAAVVGIEARLVEVQVDAAPGLPVTRTLGLPDKSIRESADRVFTAIHNCGFLFPSKRITINLAPADLPKAGSGFDLPVALGMLAAVLEEPCGVVALERYLWVGELTLEGTVRSVRGILPVALEARRRGMAGVVCAPGVAAEAAVVAGLEARVAHTLQEAWAFLRGKADLPRALPPVESDERLGRRSKSPPDLADVKGQAMGRRALEIAAAGEHNLLFVGPPGAGKTMLARRLPGILPPLSNEEALTVSCLYSVAGLMPPGAGLIRAAPFRAPHHTATPVAIAGGGPHVRPGELSLACHGVLFLDELPEFQRGTLETLRQPLEDGSIRIDRARGSVQYPSRFLLAAAMNPCPCGLHGDPRRACACSPPQVTRYRNRVSGPLLDRMDLQVWVPVLSAEDLMGSRRGEPSAAVRERVLRARRRQNERGGVSNGRLDRKELDERVPLDPASRRLLSDAITRFGLSARAYDRILRMALTISDLEEAPVRAGHIAEAIQYRVLDREAAGAPVA